MEADRLRARRLPEDVVLEDPHAPVAGELGGKSARPLGEDLCGDHVVGLPRVAELPRAVLGIASRNPVHLVGPDARLVLAVEQRDVALAEQLEPTLGDEAFLEDQEAVLVEGGHLLRRERVDHCGYFPSVPGAQVREDARPHALENVASAVGNHLDTAAEPLLPPLRLGAAAFTRAEEEQRLGLDGVNRGLALERRRRHEDEPVDELAVSRGELERDEAALGPAHDSGR